MNEFAEKGPPGGANGMAALAILRALLRTLEKAGVLSQGDVYSIVTDALAQIPDIKNERAQEARRLVQGLNQ